MAPAGRFEDLPDRVDAALHLTGRAAEDALINLAVARTAEQAVRAADTAATVTAAAAQAAERSAYATSQSRPGALPYEHAQTAYLIAQAAARAAEHATHAIKLANRTAEDTNLDVASTHPRST